MRTGAAAGRLSCTGGGLPGAFAALEWGSGLAGDEFGQAGGRRAEVFHSGVGSRWVGNLVWLHDHHIQSRRTRTRRTLRRPTHRQRRNGPASPSRPCPRDRGRELPKPRNQPPNALHAQLEQEPTGGSNMIAHHFSRDHFRRPQTPLGNATDALCRISRSARSLSPSRARSGCPSLDTTWTIL